MAVHVMNVIALYVYVCMLSADWCCPLRSLVILLFTENKVYRGVAVAPSEPRTQCGRYWGYKTRLVTCLSEAISQCPFKEGYDLMIGTSEKGESVDSFQIKKQFKLVALGSGICCDM